MVQVRDVKIKVLLSLFLSMKEEWEEWEKLVDFFKVIILNCYLFCIKCIKCMKQIYIFLIE